MLIVVVALWINTSVGMAVAQATNSFEQLIQLKLNQPLPESLQKQAESVNKRGDIQTYYFLSGNYVYPHFIETQHGLVVHVAVYLDSSKTAEYTQKLQSIGSPEIVLQNTETESIFGFPTKGIVFVVNGQKQPVVYEWMQPRTEREIVQTYDTETVLAAADSLEESSDPRELLLKYPTEVIAIAVGFYSTVISNPKLAVVVVGLVIALIITMKIIKAVKAAAAQQRESRITKLMEESLAINRQRALAATVADTVVVPTQQIPTAENSTSVFDASTIESADQQFIAEVEKNNSALVTAMSNLTDEERTAAASAYDLPAAEELQQMIIHNPQLKNQANSNLDIDGDSSRDMPDTQTEQAHNNTVQNVMSTQVVATSDNPESASVPVNTQVVDYAAGEVSVQDQSTPQLPLSQEATPNKA